jgi:tetratricopeptide (TPR) repeat protein
MSIANLSRLLVFFIHDLPKHGELFMRTFLISLALGLAAYAGMLYIFAERQKDNLATAYFNRGAVYDTKGEYQRAIADYDQALRIDPNMTKAAENRQIAWARLAKTAQTKQ